MALGLRLRKQLALRITTDKKISRDKRRHHEAKEVDQEDREDPGQAGAEELEEPEEELLGLGNANEYLVEHKLRD